MELIEMLRNVVIPLPKPAVAISGGLDSTIVLHFLREKTDEDIYTYTAKFGVDGDEIEWARMVAETYDTIHKAVDCSGYLKRLPEILKGFVHPRYNVWGYLLVEQAKNDGRRTFYIGEGSDEHFGGYLDKPYLYAWADHIAFIEQVYTEICLKLGLRLEMPFRSLDWKQTIKYHSPPNKYYLREVLKGKLPDFIVSGRAKLAPAFRNYWLIWDKELKDLFPEFTPESEEDIRKLLRYIAVKAWLKANNNSHSEFGKFIEPWEASEGCSV